MLTTKRLVLRALEESDTASVYSLYCNDDFMRYSGIRPWLSHDEARKFLAHAMAQASDGSALRMGLLQNEQFIGTCSLLNIDSHHRRCEIGYGLAPSHWGLGLASEAVAAILELAFRSMGIRRIQANVDPENLSSIKLLKRLGFRPEGTLREHLLTTLGPVDSSIFGLLDREWNALGQ